MKNNYTDAINFILKWEGGYVNHPSDPGGATNRGITLKTAQTYWKPDATAEDLRSIPLATVHDIYRKQYADKVGFDTLPAGLDLLVFDAAVLSGPARAKTWLKGTTTIAEYQAKRLAFYQSLRHWSVFGKGWTNRLNSGTKEANRIASPANQLTKDVATGVGTAVVIGSQTPGLPTSVVPVEAVNFPYASVLLVVIGTALILGVGTYIWSRWKRYKQTTKNSINPT